MLQYLRNLVTMRRDRDDAGASAVEYGLLVIGIAGAVIAALLILGPAISDLFTDTKTCIDGQTSATC